MAVQSASSTSVFFLHRMHKGFGALQESVDSLGLEQEEGLAIHV